MIRGSVEPLRRLASVLAFVLWTVTPVHAALSPAPADTTTRAAGAGGEDGAAQGFDDAEAERAAFAQIETFNNQNHLVIYRERDPEVRGRFAQMLWDFVRRDTWHDPQLRGTAWQNLFALAKTDSTMDADVILEIVRNLGRFAADESALVYGEAPMLLAERTPYRHEAEAIVRRGLDSVRVQLERDRALYDGDQAFSDAVEVEESILYDALGWVLFQSGRMDEAESALQHAHELWAENVHNLFHLGRFYEETGSLNRAESFYAAGAVAPTPLENPNRAALRALYQRRHGSLDGWDEYAAAFDRADREQRRASILGARRPHPEIMPSFELEQIGGARLPSDSFAGRVAVINFWGVWCAWCVREMPELQQLHERYAGDDEVVVLTINNDEDPEVARTWIAENGFDFIVLRDDGFVRDVAGVRAFPTTWFVDRDGRIAFEKRGWTEQLLEEFAWRIEALRDGWSARAARPNEVEHDVE